METQSRQYDDEDSPQRRPPEIAPAPEPGHSRRVGFWQSGDQAQADEVFAHGVLDALSVEICVIDEEGKIVSVNRAWREFARANASGMSHLEEGADYLAVCEAATGPEGEQARTFAAGLRAVIGGQRESFSMEYPCHSAQAQRWFSAHARRVSDRAPLRVVVEHENITSRKLMLEPLQAALRQQETLRREIHHRVKNNLQVISSLLFLQSTRISDPQLLEVLREGQSRVRSIGLIHELLCQRDDLASIRVSDYVHQLAEDLFSTYEIRDERVKLQLVAEELSLDLNTALACGLILTELITNALKYAFAEGRSGVLRIELKRLEESTLRLSVRDDGAGFPPGLDLAESPSLGLQLVRDLTRQLGGTLLIEEGHPGIYTEITFQDAPRPGYHAPAPE